MSLYPVIRKALFALDAEKSHDVTLSTLKTLGPSVSRLLGGAHSAAPVHLFGIDFPNPVGLAAGLDKDAEAVDALAALGFGFVEVGTVTPVGQAGNAKPRLFRLPEHQAIINRMGFNNAGVDALLSNLKHSKRQVPIGINIGKNLSTPVDQALRDYKLCLETAYASADYITVNVSSPNTPGLRALQHGDYLAQLLGELRRAQLELADKLGYYRPVLVKIAPDIDDQQIIDIALTVERFEIDGVIATNTTQARESIAQHPHADEAGGLSGSPVTEQSTEVLAKLVQALDGSAPVIGVGGIMSAADAQAKFQAGAAMIQLYTGFIYQGPALIHDCVKAYTAYKDSTTP